MTRARRGVFLLALAVVLGTLAASDVSRREAALDARLAPLVDVVVAARDVPAGRALRSADLAVQPVPERYAPANAAPAAAELIGRKLLGAVPAGGLIAEAHLEPLEDPGAVPVRRGERALEIVGLGSPDSVVAGARVDVLVTRERRDGGAGATEVALEDVEVLSARRTEADQDSESPRVAATLRLTAAQAVSLAALQSAARSLRLLPRALGDRRRSGKATLGAAPG
jgi:pilus assembly protein CpaB